MSEFRVLLVRYSAIGDAVMAAHLATRIRRSWPRASITWAVEKRCSAVVAQGPLVDHRAEFDRDRFRGERLSLRSWRDEMAFYRMLRKERPVIGLDLQGHGKTAVCLRAAAPQVRLAIGGTDAAARRMNPVFSPPGNLHTVERQAELWKEVVRRAGPLAPEPEVPFDTPWDPPTDLPIMPPLRKEREIVRAMVGPRPLATIAIGAGHPDKAYPGEAWAQVAASLLDAGCAVALVGGPTERGPKVPRALDFVGRLSLTESMAWIAESQLALAADTGAGHIAAAYGVRVVSVFGPTDPAVFRPYTRRGIVLRQGNRPDAVPPEAVVEAARQLVEGDAD